MSVLVFPNWYGEDLHNSTVCKLEGLSKSIEACVSGYFNDEETEINKGQSEEDPVYKGYIVVLDSKSYDETLSLHASWEPGHLRHYYKFPGMQYVKLEAVLRRFGYTVVALHGCMQTEIKPGFGYQQQLVPGMRLGGAPMSNFFVPLVQQGQQGQRPGGRRTGSVTGQKPQQPIPLM